jgi:hypothetical protein
MSPNLSKKDNLLQSLLLINKMLIYAGCSSVLTQNRHFSPTFDEFCDFSADLRFHPMGESENFWLGYPIKNLRERKYTVRMLL